MPLLSFSLAVNFTEINFWLVVCYTMLPESKCYTSVQLRFNQFCIRVVQNGMVNFNSFVNENCSCLHNLQHLTVKFFYYIRY